MAVMIGAIDRRRLLLGLGTALVATKVRATFPANAVTAAPVLDQVSAAMFEESPETATFLGIDTGARSGLRHHLTDRSLAGVEQLRNNCSERLRILRSVDTAGLSWARAIDLRSTLYAHELANEGFRFSFGDNLVLPVALPGSNSPYAVSQGAGFFATIPDFLDSQHKIETRDDAEAYLDRLQAFARGLDGETERLRHDAAKQVVAPAYILDTVIAQQRTFSATPVADWGLVGSLASRAAKAGVTGDWSGRARILCERDVAPALARQTMAAQALRTAASADAGVWKLPEGEAYYAWTLKAGTTTLKNPDEIHALGLEQIRILDAQMDRLLKATGMTKGTVGERLSALSKDPKQLYPDTKIGRTDLIAYLNQVVASVRSRLPKAFKGQHKADLVIKRVPAAIEAGAPYGYAVYGSIDGSRPASYYINLHDMTNWPRFTLPTLCFHEGLPGHIWESAFTQGLPLIRSQYYFNAYSEGWALYAEQLADELGMYEGDPLGQLGYLQSIQFRACRLVLDTGLHAKRWTRDQAIAWLIKTNGIPADSAKGEVDRYCVWPGQACGYQIGHLELTRLREKARTAMGGRFSLPAFHDAVLQGGPVPMTLLEDEVDRFIAGRSN
jgi:uncharacterized protein (DUF885 family)